MSCSYTRENIDNRLSMLPDEVLSHILSLLPTRLAVQTSILSKRWKDSWMYVHNLDLDDDLVHMHEVVDSFIQSMDRILQPPRTSNINLFRLRLSRIPFLVAWVSYWINAAVRLNVSELDIQVIRMLELPLSVFTSKTLTLLRLKRGESDPSVWECSFSVSLPSLKTLDLAVFGNLCGNAFRLIYGCPILENLYLEVSNCQEDLKFNISTLKRLGLTLVSQTECRMNNVVLIVPSLKSLFVGGHLSSYFVMEDVSSLAEVSVLASPLALDDQYDRLLEGVRGVQKLSIKKIPFDFSLPIFPNMKHLELKKDWHTSRIIQFLENSPALEHLCIDELEGPQYWDELDDESCWIEPKMIPACLLTNLTTLKISRCNWNYKFEFQFLEYLLERSEILKMVTVSCEGLPSGLEGEKRLCAQLFKFPRASGLCKFQFHGNYYRSISMKESPALLVM